MACSAGPSPRIKANNAQESTTATPALIGFYLGPMLGLQIAQRIAPVEASCELIDGIFPGRSCQVQAQPAIGESLDFQGSAGAPAQVIADDLGNDHLSFTRQPRRSFHLTRTVRRCDRRVNIER